MTKKVVPRISWVLGIGVSRGDNRSIGCFVFASLPGKLSGDDAGQLVTQRPLTSVPKSSVDVGDDVRSFGDPVAFDLCPQVLYRCK